MRRDLAVGLLVALMVTLPGGNADAKPVKVDAPAGVYTLDKAHSSIVFRVDHLGFSNFTARMTQFEVTLHFDPAHPARSQVDATIDPNSLESDNPPPGFLDALHGSEWLDAVKFPAITFHSSRIVMTGPRTARVTGDLTLHGVTKPLTLNAKFNAGYPGSIYDPHARVGFSLTGSFKRSDYGITIWVPKPGTAFGVGDKVGVVIETELSGPAWIPPKKE